ncbi:deoxyribose-phosphate aldolase [Cyclobacterium jeungdonense]|uniref:Deoxyribose-phosphate aldolase n=1 Tax=Cyclobacterium jeungdonense TaxID=708087 RepID=A0ABT8C546_9BACT|nr:deoxyribose-phosphate aldolase [Cyclobacterium jeungdonense]MDN3687590.1 deoxyribose-phosphate aldolase [Cyclobacterium jeungdonense]
MKNLQRYIEHSALHPVVDEQAIRLLISQALKYQFRAVCIPPFWVKKVKRELAEEDIQVVTVVGFPFGYNMSQTKLAECNQALKDGADELDVVWSLSAFKSGMNWPKIELAQLANRIHDDEKLLKVIVETAYLNSEELEQACVICRDAGADYVKTSTGYAPKGAEVGTILEMRRLLPSQIGIKASGGIKTLEQALEMIDAGADRIGTSSGDQIMDDFLRNHC